MGIKFSKTSIQRMDGLHPDIVRVLYAAAEMASPDEDFFIIEGVRSKEKMWENYGKGRTAEELAKKGVPAHYAKPGVGKVTWLNNPLASNHRRHEDGYGHAVDLAPWPLDWNDLGRFRKVAAVIAKAAEQEGVRLEWGGNWKQTKDYPHFELVP